MNRSTYIICNRCKKGIAPADATEEQLEAWTKEHGHNGTEILEYVGLQEVEQ